MLKGGINFEEMEQKLASDMNGILTSPHNAAFLNSVGAMFHAIWNAAFEVVLLAIVLVVVVVVAGAGAD